MKREKRYYVPGMEELNQLIETPASKEQTEKERFVWSIAIASISAVAAIIAAVVSFITLIRL